MQKKMNPESLFSLNDHLESLKDDLVERLDEVVDFEIFRDFFTEVLGYGYNPRGRLTVL